MGNYDTLHGHCPNCARKYFCQTKRFACQLADVHVGSRIPGATKFTGNWVLKKPCPGCGKPVVAVVNSGVLHSLMTVEQARPTEQELIFGATGSYEVRQ